MRIDSLLNALCLVKTRSRGRKGCETERIKLNGAVVKPSRETAVGDIIEIRYPDRVLVVELLEIPAGQVARKNSGEYYRIVREIPMDKT